MSQYNEVLSAEHQFIKHRRRAAGLREREPNKDAIGLALSGGGIRSAIFNLGLLQAMERFGALQHVDYLSTVSGGGYIGASLTWLICKLRKFPFAISSKEGDNTSPKILRWIRRHGEYLAPGNGLDRWALIAAVLKGLCLNLAVFVPVILIAVYLLKIPWEQNLPQSVVGAVRYSLKWVPDSIQNQTTGFHGLFSLGLGVLAIFVGILLISGLVSGLDYRIPERVRRKVFILFGRLLKIGILLVVVGSVPLVDWFLRLDFLVGREGWISNSISLSGALTILLGLKSCTSGNETKWIRSLVFSVGLSLLIYGLLLWAYNAQGYASYLPHLLCVTIALAIFADINHVSMHRYYRDRLLQAFLWKPCESEIAGRKGSPRDSDNILLKDILGACANTTAPYHIVNTTMLTLASKDPRFSERGGESFILSPAFCGSDSTQYVQTSEYLGGKMDLATAFAISGGAVDPNTGFTRSRPLAFLMTLLNIRLGYWARNPTHPWKQSWVRFRPLWHLYLIREMLGVGIKETSRYVHLSDGGHFDNLGLYELVRRKCRSIIVSDATADPDWTFADLARVSKLVRVDFDAEIDIDTRPLRPRGKDRISRRAFVTGRIRYNDGTEASLLYINTCVIKNLSEDIYGYRRRNPTYPDQSTADQFFDEAQFEAYRMLGYQIGERVSEESSWRLFSCPNQALA